MLTTQKSAAAKGCKMFRIFGKFGRNHASGCSSHKLVGDFLQQRSGIAFNVQRVAHQRAKSQICLW